MGVNLLRGRLSGLAQKVIVLLTACVVIGVGAFILLGVSPLLQIDRVEVHGLHRVTLMEVEKFLGVEQGDSILSTDSANARERIEMIPGVKEAHVSRSLVGGVVTVNITEHRPIALAMTQQSYWALVAEDGTVLSPGMKLPPELPRLSGIRAAGGPGSSLGSDSSSLISLLVLMSPEMIEEFLALRLEDKGEIAGTLNNSTEVLFGDNRRLGAKVVSLAATFGHLEKLEKKAQLIDVAVPSVPKVKWAQ
ncbi:MAG: hypothetical protein CMA21_05520 [Euryarchaeota archaeon]|mgnify:FL=1|nr:hypothetical protein [Euryarchaeota archaeon]OUW32664.1 MAG: hypothetical protein CBD32_04905 [Actinobacteria bacterium TMED172]